jgi:AraC-like DNA-binding protein
MSIPMLKQHLIVPETKSTVMNNDHYPIAKDKTASASQDADVPVLLNVTDQEKIPFIKLEPGLFLYTVNGQLDKQWELIGGGGMFKDYFTIYIDISEQLTTHILGHQQQNVEKRSYSIVQTGRDTNRSVLFLSSDMCDKIIPSSGDNYSALFIVIYKDWLRQVQGREEDINYPMIENVLSTKGSFLHEGLVRREANLVLDIIHTKPTDLLIGINIKVKVLSLLSSLIERVFIFSDGKEQRIDFAEIQRLHKIKDLLEANLEDRPPSIEQLAKHAAMGTSKFKRSFKGVFGMSCYQYFQWAKIAHARKLLDTGSYNVSEVAYRIGYHNLGHFAKVFKEYFDCLPKDYQRQVLASRKLLEEDGQ